MDNSERRSTEEEYFRELKEIRIPRIIGALEKASRALPKDHPVQSWIADIISTCRNEDNFKEWRPNAVVCIADALSEQIKNNKPDVDNIKACQDAFNQLLQASEVIAVAPKEGSLLDNDRRIKLRSGVVGEGRYLVVQTVYSSGYYYPQTGTWLKLPEVFMALHDRPPSGDSDIMIDHLGKKYKIDERGNLLPKEDSGK